MKLTGQESGASQADLAIAPISRTTLALFAGASGDHNPIHIDFDVARSAGLDDVFAHGMLSMAYLARLLTDRFPVEQIRSIAVRFTAITPVHAEPTCRGVVRAVDRVDDECRVMLDLTVVLADGTTTLSGVAAVAVDEETGDALIRAGAADARAADERGRVSALPSGVADV